MNRRIVTVLAVLAGALLVMAGCEHGDHVAPAESIIDVAATPSTVVVSESPSCIGLLGIDKCGTSEIVATVSSGVGVPLPDQDVRFTNTAGLLFIGTLDNPEPIANLPVRTDSYGNAHVRLVTGSTTTVNARSGTATGSLSLQTTTASISSISLEQDTDSANCSAQPGEITDCGDRFCLKATVLDSAGEGIPGLQIQFRLQNPTGEEDFTGTFTPPAPTTSNDPPDDVGIARSALSAANDCGTKCALGKCVSVDVVAFTTGGIESPPYTILVSIP